MARCWIIKSWECYVESDEIPLEVCKLCVETRLKVRLVRRKNADGDS